MIELGDTMIYPIYIAIDLSQYELPLYVGTRKEVAKWANLRPESVSDYYNKGRINRKNKCKFIKLYIDENEPS